MRIRVLAITSLSIVALGCSGSDPDPAERDGGTADGAVADGGPRSDAGADGGVVGPCAPQLSVTPTTAAVLPFGLYTITPQGGTGAYRFSLEQNESDAIVNALSGAYLAGAEGGAVDRVLVTDLGCTGEARVDIRVVEPLAIRPANIVAPPTTAWTFDGVGGTGDFSFTLLVDGSGATLSPAGAYVAGPNEGTDRVQLTDNRTGQTAEATIAVAVGAEMTPNPPFVFVGQGETFRLGIDGGSGFVEVVEDEPSFALVDGRVVRGVAPGRARVTLRDVYTRQTAPLSVTTVAAQRFTPTRYGPQQSNTRTHFAGDLDGDGRGDAIVSHPEASVSGYLAGAVFVYRGTEGGFDPTPAQILAGETRREYFGNDVALGDFDGDGQKDLVVGAPRIDSGGTDIGAAIIYRGLPGGFFDPTPWRTLSGRFGGDWYGWSLTVCDFDDDGRDDIAVGGYLTEDRVRATRANDQGGVFVYFNKDTGFGDLADQTLWGDVPDGSGEWVGVAGMRHGTALASGDVNGDGVCDLVVGSNEWDQSSNTQDGLLMVYAGGTTGVSERPVLAWANDDAADRGGQFARRLAVGDLDGDQKADIAASNFGFDGGNGDQYGAIRVFRGRDFAGPVAGLASYKPADFEIEHDGAYDWFGFDIAIGDVTGDGVADIVTGNVIDEVDGDPGNTGTLAIFEGRAGALPDPMAAPRKIRGAEANDRLGMGVAIVDDVNGDGRNDLFSFAAFGGSTGGVEVGAPFVVTTGDAATLAELDHPGVASGAYFGHDARIIGDVNGDGIEDLVVTAPYHPAVGRYSGAAFLYTGSRGGFSTEPALEIAGFERHSGSDFFGWSAAPAGDFDGDGRQDFAIVARLEDLPSTFDTNVYAPEASCTAARNDAGAVFVFRGSGFGLPSVEPSFIYFGPVAGDGLREVDGGFDFDGDGRDDLVVGNLDDDENAGNAGMMAVVRGRPAVADRIVVICDEYVRVLGRNANDQLGRSVAAIGDLDGDGCDEVAGGAPFADPTANNEGEVRVLFGFGGAVCASAPMMTSLRSTVTNAQGGYALGGGNIDLDGDGSPELAVGLPALSVGGVTTGGAFVVDGAYLGSLPRVAAGNVPPSYASMHPSSGTPLVAVGRSAGEAAGRGVALIAAGAYPAGVVVGSPNGSVGGVTFSGGARMFAYGPGGLSAEPIASFGGETSRTSGLLGERVRAGVIEGAPAFVVMGYDGSGVVRDSGSAYVLDFLP